MPAWLAENVDLPLEGQRFFFVESEMRELFPKRIVDWMIARGSAEARAELPVVVATRMSLSFPLLLSAVPLWAVDFGTRAEEKAYERCWFSDRRHHQQLSGAFLQCADPEPADVRHQPRLAHAALSRSRAAHVHAPHEQRRHPGMVDAVRRPRRLRAVDRVYHAELARQPGTTPLPSYRVSAAERAAMRDASLAFLAHVRHNFGSRPFRRAKKRPRPQPVLRAVQKT